MNECNARKLTDPQQKTCYKTISDWMSFLRNDYDEILSEIFPSDYVKNSHALYSSFEILNEIVDYEGGLASAYEIIRLVNSIYGTNLQ